MSNALLAEEPESAVPAWRQERHRRIVAAATALFGRSAYDSVQMDDIAQAAGVGKPTLYRYFPSKDELFLAVFDNALDTLQADLEGALAVERAPEETVAHLIQILVEGLSTQLASMRLLTGDQAALTDRWRRLFAERRRNLIDLLRRALVRGRDAGVFKDIDLEATPPLLLGMIRGGLMGAGDIPLKRLSAAATALVLRGALRDSS